MHSGCGLHWHGTVLITLWLRCRLEGLQLVLNKTYVVFEPSSSYRAGCEFNITYGAASHLACNRTPLSLIHDKEVSHFGRVFARQTMVAWSFLTCGIATWRRAIKKYR